jgi:hypothetical protein
MLFDLRGRHRRRAVRVIYTGLALLMGIGLVGFGVGGGFGGGGLLNAASKNEGSNATSFANQIKKYEKITKQQPNNVSAWENLTNAQLHEAGGEAYVSQSGAVTSKGKELFHQAANSWNSYIALNPAKPNSELAQRMVAVFGEEGLNEPAAAVQVLEIVVAARPTSASLYAALAEYAYRAHNSRVGDLASAKAVALAPTTQRVRLKAELAAIKNHPNGNENTTVNKGANGTFTATTKGKTFPVTPGPNKTFTAATNTTPTTTTPLGASPTKTK